MLCALFLGIEPFGCMGGANSVCMAVLQGNFGAVVHGGLVVFGAMCCLEMGL